MLKFGFKRVYLMFEGDFFIGLWFWWMIIFLECDVLRIDSRNIDKVDEIIILIIKEFIFVLF